MSELHVVKKAVVKGRERLFALDLLKVVACILVVVIHVTAAGVVGYQPGSKLQQISVLLNSFSQFAVPAFLFASGYGLSARFKGIPRVDGVLRFWGKRIETVLLPYLIWSLIYLLVQQRFLGICYGAWGMLEMILSGGAFYHLYFMVVLIQFYLVFPLLLLVRRRFANYNVDVFIMLALFLVYGLWLKRYVPMSDRFFMSYLPFFYAGMVVAERPLKTTALTVIGIAGAVAFADYLVTRMTVFKAITPLTMLSLPYAWEIFSLAAVLLLFTWFNTLPFSPLMGVRLMSLSSVTFDVYLAHPLVLFFTTRWLRAAGVNSLSLELVLGFVLGLALPTLARLGYNEIEKRVAARKQ